MYKLSVIGLTFILINSAREICEACLIEKFYEISARTDDRCYKRYGEYGNWKFGIVVNKKIELKNVQ